MTRRWVAGLAFTAGLSIVGAACLVALVIGTSLRAARKLADVAEWIGGAE